MNNYDDLCETLESSIESIGLARTVYAVAEICRNRGNLLREDGPPYPDTARLWTHFGAVLFNAGDEIKNKEPL